MQTSEPKPFPPHGEGEVELWSFDMTPQHVAEFAGLLKPGRAPKAVISFITAEQTFISKKTTSYSICSMKSGIAEFSRYACEKVRVFVASTSPGLLSPKGPSCPWIRQAWISSGLSKDADTIQELKIYIYKAGSPLSHEPSSLSS